MPIDRKNVRDLLQNFRFRDLLIEEMGWGHASNSSVRPIDETDGKYQRRSIAELGGVTIFEVFPTDRATGFPDAKMRRTIHSEIESLAYENIIILLDDDTMRTQAMWYWMKREDSRRQPREHSYFRNQPGDLFMSRIDGLLVEMNDLRPDGTMALVDMTRRLTDTMDVEKVTRKFYTEFNELRGLFIDHIEGIDDEADRFWYASVLLNRLMFIYLDSPDSTKRCFFSTV